MNQKQIEELADIIVTRPGFKKVLSGEISRQLKEAVLKKETAISKKADNRNKAIK